MLLPRGTFTSILGFLNLFVLKLEVLWDRQMDGQTAMTIQLISMAS